MLLFCIQSHFYWVIRKEFFMHHGKNDFAEISKSLIKDLKIILDHQNNVECLNVDDNAVKNFNILAITV